MATHRNSYSQQLYFYLYLSKVPSTMKHKTSGVARGTDVPEHMGAPDDGVSFFGKATFRHKSSKAIADPEN